MATRRQIWHSVADEFGLVADTPGVAGSPSLTGSVDGIGVRVESVTNRVDINATRYTVSYRRAGGSPSMMLTPAKTVHRSFVKKTRAPVNIATGDDAFDELVVVDAVDGPAVIDYLTADRRQTVAHLFGKRAFYDSRITADSISISTEEVVDDEALLRETLTTLIHAARLLCDQPVDAAALPPYEPGPLDIIAETPLTEPDFAETPAAMPDGPDTSSPNQVESPAPAAAIDAEIDAELNEPATAPVALDQITVMHDLFDSDRMGFETDEHFATNYNDAHIEWHGEVDTVRSFSSDRDFVGAGEKVTILLGYLREEQLRSREVKAVVQLAPDSQIERGDTVTVAGRLVRADRFTNSLYVADADLR